MPRSDVYPSGTTTASDLKRSKTQCWTANKAKTAQVVGRALLIAQFLWLASFSLYQWRQGTLTLDFTFYHQAAWEIAHGHLNPFSSTRGAPFWQNNGEWVFWAIAELTRLPPHGLWLLWVQDIAIFVTGWTALSWVSDIVRSGDWTSKFPDWAAIGVAVTLLVSNPGVYASAAFDLHTEPIAACFATLAGRDMWRGKTRRLWIWVSLTLATVYPAGLFVVALGVAGLAVRAVQDRGRTSRKTSAAVAVVGLTYMILLLLVHANGGSALSSNYGYLAGQQHGSPNVIQMAFGAISHPSRAVGQLVLNRTNLWHNIAPSGVIGVASPWGWAMTAFVTLPNALAHGQLFATSAFQNFPAYAFMVLGTVLVLGRIGRLPIRLSGLVAGFIAAYLTLLAAVGAAVNLPRYPSKWVAVTPGSASALADARTLIPSSAEVVVAQGVAGRFAERRYVYPVLTGPVTIPVRKLPVYFVLTSTVGIEPTAVIQEAAHQVSQFATLLLDRDGILVFYWRPPPSVHTLTLG